MISGLQNAVVSYIFGIHTGYAKWKTASCGILQKSPLFMRFSAEKRCFSSNSLTKHMTVFKQQPGNSCP